MAEFCILLGDRQQPFDRVLVVIMFLTFHDDFLTAINKLVSPFGGEVFIGQKVFSALKVFSDTCFLILGYALCKYILKKSIRRPEI